MKLMKRKHIVEKILNGEGCFVGVGSSMLWDVHESRAS